MKTNDEIIKLAVKLVRDMETAFASDWENTQHMIRCQDSDNLLIDGSEWSGCCNLNCAINSLNKMRSALADNPLANLETAEIELKEKTQELKAARDYMEYEYKRFIEAESGQ